MGSPDVFHVAILDELVKGIGNFKPLAKLDEAFVPSNAMKVVGPNLPTTVEYSIEVGMVIAHELHLAIVESIKRLGKRYLQILDSQGADSGKAVTFEQLVLSKPIDRYVGKVLCSPGIVKPTALEGKAAEAAKGKAVGRKPITKIALEGERDPKLWNWIRVGPNDATAEDVAAELFKRGNTHDKHGDANAYMLAAAPPLFGLPKKQALEMPQLKQIAQQFMFRGGMGDVFDVEDSVDKQLLQVANSSAVDAVVHEPNGGRVDENIERAPAELNQVQDQLRDVALQLTFIANVLQPWGLANKLVGANAYVMRQRGDVSHADQKKLGDISAVVDGQKGRLTRIDGAITKLAASAADLGGANPQSDEAAPLREILDLSRSRPALRTLPLPPSQSSSKRCSSRRLSASARCRQPSAE